MSRKTRVLFVCAGNICRSPMAEAVFRHQVEQAGLADRFEIDSAGTGDWHSGEPAHERTRQRLAQAGIPYTGRARQVKADELGGWDYVLVMDRENLSHVNALARGRQAGRIELLLREPHRAGLVHTDEVPDPYYTGVYDEVYRLVTIGGAALLERLSQPAAD